MSAALTIAILVVGATGITGQIVLMRELFVCFFGNELSLGIIMASWLLLEALGSWLGGRLSRRHAGLPECPGTRSRIEAIRVMSPCRMRFVVAALLAALALPVMIYFARTSRPLLHIAPGEIVGPSVMLLISLLALLPVSLLHGASFTLGIAAQEGREGRVRGQTPGQIRALRGSDPAHALSSPAGRVYVTETLGSIIGGLALSFLLVAHLGSFQIALLVAAANSAALVLLARKGKLLSAGLAGLALLQIGMLIAGLPGTLDHSSLRQLYPGQQAVYYGNSHYGNITVLKREEQYTFLADGVPAITLPNPDYTFVEDFVHIPMLSHPDPHRVLLIGGGIGGVIAELLKYPGIHVDYCELDPALVAVVRRLFPDDPELIDPRVSVKEIDGRRLLGEMPARSYDVILVSFLSPTTLQINRYFSQEFLKLARSRLSTGGLLACIAPGSSAYMNDAMARLNRLQLNTLQSVFGGVQIVPGDFNIFLAGDACLPAPMPVLGLRLRSYGFSTRIVSPEYLVSRLSAMAAQQFEQRIMSVANPGVNSDRRPIGVIAALAYAASLSSPPVAKLLSALRVAPSLWVPVALVLLFGVIVPFVASRRRRNLALGYAVFSTGLAAAAASLMTLLIVQTSAGAMYLYLALVTTGFMAGAAAGGAMSARLERPHLYFLEVGIAAIGSILVAAGTLAFLPVTSLLFLLLALCVLAGALTGAEYPLVTTMSSASGIGPFAPAAGAVYAADLLGGSLGALAVPLILVPVIGMLPTALVIAGAKLVSILMLRISSATT
jgi:spermidine synthase